MGGAPNKRRVVVTGMGAITPLGNSVSETWNQVLAGKSGAGKITSFDATECAVKIAAEVKNFEISKFFAPEFFSTKDARRVGKFVHLALAASLEAYRDSGLEAHRSHIPSERIGVNIGVGMGGLPEIEVVHSEFLSKGFKRITPFFIPQVIPNMASGELSIRLGLRGPNLCSVTACATSAHSIGESFRAIQYGSADIMFAGGSESVVCALAVGGFASMRALSTRNETPEKASRPFDETRDGFLLGEGAATLVLEERESALKRGAKIYGELLGYGLSSDAYHMTSPAPEGEGGYRAMKMALEESGLAASQIGYINAHGTSTPVGDVEEARAIAKLFPANSAHARPLVSSTKSMTGHLLGAAGAAEALFCLLAIRDGKIPPTINLDHLDPACKELGLDFVPHQVRDLRVEYALSNSFGFGSTNASLLLGRHT